MNSITAADPPPTHPRRMALLIPLILPGSNSSRNEDSNLSLTPSSTSSSSRSNSRGVILLILSVPAGSSSSSSSNVSSNPTPDESSNESSPFGSLSSLGALLGGLGGFSSMSSGTGLNFNSLFEQEEDRQFHEILNRLMQSFQPQGPPPTSKSFLESLPSIKMDESLSIEHVRCPVCLLDWEVDEDVTQLPCKHVYHPDCIKTWLKQANTCCVCRHALPVDEEKEDSNQSSTENLVEADSDGVFNLSSLFQEEYEEIPDLVDGELDDQDFLNFDNMPSLEESILSDLNITFENLEIPELIDSEESSTAESNAIPPNEIQVEVEVEVVEPVVAVEEDKLNKNTPLIPRSISTEIFRETINTSTIPSTTITSTSINTQPTAATATTQNKDAPSSSSTGKSIVQPTTTKKLRMVDGDENENPNNKKKNTNSRGPMNWLKKQASKFTCMRGFM